MCTVVVSVDPQSVVPLLFVGVRDEFLDRPWIPPGWHWPERWPGLIGGQDLRAGGTWLAVNPSHGRVAAVLNAFGAPAPEEHRLSRGELPLLAAVGGAGQLELDRFDPFHLVIADLDHVTVSTWDGRALTEIALGVGMHLIVNSGVEGRVYDELAPPWAIADMASRITHFRSRLDEVPRPEPVDGDTEKAWGAWLPIIDGDGLDPRDPRALVLRRDFSERGPWGTGSISLLGLRPDGLRYDFSGTPGDSSAWQVTLS